MNSLENSLNDLPNWTALNGSALGVFVFASHKMAVRFQGAVMMWEEALGHHADSLAVDEKIVRMEVTTHDEGNTLTTLDMVFASRVQDMFNSLPSNVRG